MSRVFAAALISLAIVALAVAAAFFIVGVIGCHDHDRVLGVADDELSDELPDEGQDG